MSVLDVKDRIPTNVLSNEAVRYGVYDEEGKLIRYEYMKREDEPIEEGTAINKVLLDNFQGDLYTQDRYNVPTIRNDIIQVQNSDGVYYAHYPQITRPDNEEAVIIQAGKTCAGKGYVLLDRLVIVKQAKVTFYNDSSVKYIRLYGSNNRSDWTLIGSTATSTSKKEGYFEVADNANSYKYYTIFGYTTGSPYYIYVYNFQITQWVEATGDDTTTTQTGELIPYMTQSPHYGEPTYKSQTIYINELNLPLTSYEKGKIVNIEGLQTTEPIEEKVLQENIFPNSWTTVSTTQATSGKYTLKSSNTHSQSSLIRACDGNVGTNFTFADPSNMWVQMQVPTEYKILTMRINTFNTHVTKSFEIHGSKDGSTWTELFFTSSAISNPIIELNNPDYYKYYKIVITQESHDTVNFGLDEWGTEEVVQRFGGNVLTSFENPYLNINNLGNKQINGTINHGEKYSLVYNGESWDIIGATVVAGGVNATSTLQTIYLGFTPDLVICYRISNNAKNVASNESSEATLDEVPRILTKACPHSDGAIVSDGFTLATNSSHYVYYIAIKF